MVSITVYVLYNLSAILYIKTIKNNKFCTQSAKGCAFWCTILITFMTNEL